MTKKNMVATVVVVMLSLMTPFFVLSVEETSEQDVVMDESVGGTDDLASIQKEIDDYLASLSPEEREEFNKAVEEMSKMYEGMGQESSEEEESEADQHEMTVSVEPEDESDAKKEISVEESGDDE